MAFKFTKAELKTRTDLIEGLRRTQDAFSTAQETDTENLSERLDEFLTVLRDAEEFRDSTASRLREEYEEKSERWMESEKGESVGEMVDTWENADFSDVDTEDPTTLELEDYAEVLEDLPTEVE